MTVNYHIVIEPHADDAFLSMGAHIRDWTKAKQPVLIVTVYSDTRNRAADAKAYADAVGAEWLGLRFVESGGVYNDPAPASFEGVELPSGIVYLPLGILHKEHLYVRQLFEQHAATHEPSDGLGWTLRYYLDQPYAITLSNRDLVNARLQRSRVVSYMKPPAFKYRHASLFKDQSKFFFYNKDRLPHIVELIVEEALRDEY